MSILIESVTLPERGPLNVRFDVATTINMTADEARRKVSVFTGNFIADLLSGEAPGLVWQESRAYWRVPVCLSSRSMGRIGVVGSIDVDVETGEMLITDQLIADIEENAQHLATSTALGYTIHVGALTKSGLQSLLDNGQPVIVRLWTGMLTYWNIETSHVVVVVGYDEKGVYLHDPAFVTSPHLEVWDAFLAAWAEFDETSVIIALS